MSHHEEITDCPIDVEIVESDGFCRLILRGALDADAAPRISQEFERLVHGGRRILTLDLTGVTMISSAGVGSLIAGVGECRDEGGTVRIESMSPAVRHVLDMLDLLDYFENTGRNR